MGYAAQRIAIESRFSTQWGVTTPIAWDNSQYKPDSGTPFVALSILNTSEQPVSIGSTVKTRNGGFININIFVPENTGTAVIEGLCDSAAAVFRYKAFSGVSCRGAEIRLIGRNKEWWQYNVSIEFQRDECITR